MTENKQTVTNPTSARIVVIAVQLLKVCFSFNPKYLLTNQNPLSLTCDIIDAPDAIAITKSALSISVTSAANNGAVIPAAVIIATVAEP